MKILIVTGGFFPAETYGGPPVSINNLCSLLCDEVEFYIICSNHELNNKKQLDGIYDGWNNRHNCKVIYIADNGYRLRAFESIINNIQPDIIYLNSLFAIRATIPFLYISKKYCVPLLLAPRGELCVNAYDGKYKKIPFLILFRTFFTSKSVWYQATSEEEEEMIIKHLKVDHNKIFRLTNAASVVNSDVIYSAKESGRCRLVFISRIQRKKNLTFALKVLKHIHSEVLFDIYGPIENQSYWIECEDVIRQLPKNITVRYRGQLNHNEVPIVFSQYNAFLFPTLSENYGHVIIESMQNCCPVITSDQVPWTDLNSYKAGWSISLKKIKNFIDAIESISDMDQNEYNDLVDRCHKYVLKKTDLSELKNKYMNAFRTILSQ